MRTAAIARLLGALVVACGCGGDDANIGSVRPSLVPDPADPIGMPCAGRRGFPGLPMVHERDPIYSMQLVDVSGDSKSDLVYGTGDRIAVAIGAGDGTFHAPTYLTAPYEVYGLRITDLDTDGLMDLVFTSMQIHESTQVSYALGMGAGAFAPIVSLDATIPVMDVTVADMNADGKPDLLVLPPWYETNFAVLLQETSGFGPATTYTTGWSGSTSIEAVDLIGDGRPDVFLSMYPGLVIIPNTAAGFGSPEQFSFIAVGSGSVGRVVVRDINGDTRPDLTTLVGGYEVEVAALLGQADGTLAPAVIYPASKSSNVAGSLSVEDIDGDRALDVLVAGMGSTPAGGYVTILRGSSAGTFGAPTDIFTNFVGSGALSDVDGDGKVDMALSGLQGIAVFSNSGLAPNFDTGADMPDRIPMSSGFRMLELEDVTSDGKPDLILNVDGDAGGPPQLALSNSTADSFETVLATTTLPFESSDITLFDTNNDARRDVLRYGESHVQTALNNADGTLSLVSPLPVGASIVSATAADMNGDAFRDAVLATSDGMTPGILVAPGIGDGQFDAPTTVWSGNAGSSIESVLVGDVNEDGEKDIVFDVSPDSINVVLAGLGNGVFAPPVEVAVAVGHRLLARDLNGDAHLDLIRYGAIETTVALGDGAGAFAAPMEVAPWFSAVQVADIDGDGKLDLVGLAANEPKYIGLVNDVMAVAMGHGDGTFAPPQFYFAPNNGGFDLGVTDVDGDGQLDVVTGAHPGHLMVMRGRCYAD